MAAGVERQYYDQLFGAVDKDGMGVLPGKDALPFLTTSGLPQQTLGEIWAVADPDNNGFLTREAWYKAARIIGWMQKGNQSQVDPSLAAKPGPLPTFAGYPGPPAARGPLSANTTGSGLPPLTPADRTKFTRIFVGCGPSNGFVSGDKARDVFLKSQLSYDKLGQIWSLADTQQRGALDLTDFIIGMYLIQSSMADPSLALPAVLPAGTYEAASGGRPAPTRAGSLPPRAGSPIQRQLTGTLQPQLTGQSLTAAAATPPRPSTMSPSLAGKAPFGAPGSDAPWDVTPEAKATSDRFFSQLDSQNKGVIEGDVAVPFMLLSQLDESTLASIWDLADIREEGKLDPDEFAVAMHLINAKLAGKDVPATLPPSLIPPKLRTQAAAQPAASKDLFDLFNDEPAAPSATPLAAAFLPSPPSRHGTVDSSRSVPSPHTASAFQPAPQTASAFQPAPQAASPFQPAPQPAPQPAAHASRDLLGEDGGEAPSSVLDQSADLGNKKNQLANTNRSVAELEKTRGELEQNAASTATQLATLEAELSTARMKHEKETSAVADLRIKVGEQTATLKKLEADVISAESDLNAMRMEKQELEQALLHDKEEVRGLQKRMKELDDEKSGLKLLLEKIKKEARQQKGMVTIAKKQVSTAEASRDAVQQEVHDAEKESLAVEPPVPRALSPEATGNSRGSTNPFERLNQTASPASDHSHTASIAAFASGAAVTGAATAAALSLQHSNEQTVKDAPATAVAQDGDAAQANAEDTDKVDPFGAPASIATATDPFGVSEPTTQSHQPGFGDSFGAFTTPAPTTTVSDFDAAFADLDAGSENALPTATESALPTASGNALPTTAGNALPTAAESALPTASESALPVAAGSALPTAAESSLPPQAGFDESPRPDAERTMSTQAVAPTSPRQTPTGSTSVPAAKTGDESSDDEDEGPEDLEGPRRDYSRSLSPSAEEQSRQAAIASPIQNSNKFQSESTSSPALPSFPGAMPSSPPAPTEDVQRVRRSAPPPPVARAQSQSPVASPGPTSPGPGAAAAHAALALPSLPSASPAPAPAPVPAPAAVPAAAPALGGTAELDPFGAPTTTPPNQAVSTELDPFGAPFAPPAVVPTPPGPASAAFPKTSQFDAEDDFDFPEPGATKPNANSSNQFAPSAFDDEFASFDDDFDKAPSQVQTSSDKSYEVVSAPQGLDEWGMPKSAPAASSNTLSFDDAFGGDFTPGPSPVEPSTQPAAQAFSTANAPALPDRPDLPQPDDLEDVKKLCGMGFSRTLVVEALDANGYSFQKALNVLLDTK